MEVEMMSLIREKMTIPVPQIKAWGLAASSPLGLGPFIIMDFIEGVSLNSLLKNPNAEPDTRLIKEDISDSDIEFIYRQFANFLLQLFKLDFDRIGDRSKGFSTTTDYFQYVVRQDWEQLLHQPNSIAGEGDAGAKYASLSVLTSLIPDYVDKKYDHGPFKLICDDLSMANMIVKSKEDLTIIGMVDLEWSYTGPAQLFGTAPWWLLQDRLNNSDTSLGKESPEIVARFFKYLEIFKRVLEEEEEKMLGKREKELSNLVKHSEASGAMWLHMVLSCGFNDADSLPFTQLRYHVGTEKWRQRKEQFYGTEGMETFVTQKLPHLIQYEEDFEKMKAYKADVDNKKMTED